ncbi:MAG: hypothetical protein KA474_05600 [Acinetobacter sp.]|nr:hypothetical protein [Acinetobacter sp.]
MKLQIIAVITAVSLSGCLVVSKNEPTEEAETIKTLTSNVIDFKPSDVVTRVETKGQVICEASKPCTELTFDWKKQSNTLYKVTADLYDQEQFNIQAVNFQIDGNSFPFSASPKTALRPVLTSTVTNSSNFIEVPLSFINRFNKAKEINVTVVTDKGEISHAVLKDGKESFAYKTFKNGYGHTE